MGQLLLLSDSLIASIFVVGRNQKWPLRPRAEAPVCWNQPEEAPKYWFFRPESAFPFNFRHIVAACCVPPSTNIVRWWHSIVTSDKQDEVV